MPPAEAPEPRTLWGELWRYLLCLFLSLATFATVIETGVYDDPGRFVLDLVFGMGSYVALPWRRRRPMLVAVPITLASAVSAFAAGPALLVLVSVATRRRWFEIGALFVLAVTAATGFELIYPYDDTVWWVGLIISVLGVTALVAWGMYIGSRRELLRSLVARAESAEAEQAARVSGARADERMRIARDMHDALAHRLSMISLHAGALAYREDLGPEAVRRSAEIIRSGTHEALQELRTTLGMLRDSEGEPDRPQVTAADVTGLLRECRDVGMRLVSGIEVDLTAVPDSIGRTLYRVIQELLTNARKHAPGTVVTLSVTREHDGDLCVCAENPLPVGRSTVAGRAREREASVYPDSGLGLVGIAERLRLVGGDLDVSDEEARFAVTARIPWPS